LNRQGTNGEEEKFVFFVAELVPAILRLRERGVFEKIASMIQHASALFLGKERSR